MFRKTSPFLFQYGPTIHADEHHALRAKIKVKNSEGSFCPDYQKITLVGCRFQTAARGG